MQVQSSSNGYSPIQSFMDLNAWKKGHELIIKVYCLTKNFPPEESFALTNRLRRAVVSITANIAEGFSRNSYREKAHFYSTSLGSLTETQNHLLIAKDVGYLTEEAYKDAAEQAVTVNKLLAGLLKNTKAKILNS